VLAHLKETNLIPDQVLEVVVKAPFEGPLTLRICGETHAIGHNLAGCIKARSVEE
jgi:Fe2+ transport system protein FeoA